MHAQIGEREIITIIRYGSLVTTQLKFEEDAIIIIGEDEDGVVCLIAHCPSESIIHWRSPSLGSVHPGELCITDLARVKYPLQLVDILLNASWRCRRRCWLAGARAGGASG